MSPEISKPEWFQMAHEDGFEPKSTKKRAIRIMALTTPLLVLGVGFVFAQTQDSPTASATTTVSQAASAATAPISLSSTPAPASTPVSKAVHATTAPAASITIKKPGIAKPVGGAEDSGLKRTSDDD